MHYLRGGLRLDFTAPGSLHLPPTYTPRTECLRCPQTAHERAGGELGGKNWCAGRSPCAEPARAGDRSPPAGPGAKLWRKHHPEGDIQRKSRLGTASAFSMCFLFFPSPPPPTSSLSLSNLSLFMIAGITEEEIRSPNERKVLCKTNE